MFESLPHRFREHDLSVDIRSLLLLRKAMERGLIKTMGDVYHVLKGIIVDGPEKIGPFTKAYYDYFLNIKIGRGESLNDAILRSESFRAWRDSNLDRFGDDLEIEDLVNRFLDDVHLSSYDIKEIIDGRELWDKDDGQKDDDAIDDFDDEKKNSLLDKMADYSDLSLEELLERMQEVLDKQNSRHSGGSHWIGTGGTSPYGHGGAAKDGIRVGGTGGGKMARKVLNDRKYFPVDMDQVLNDNNVDAALASLKGVFEDSAVEQLDIKSTIDTGLKRGGLFIPELETQMDHKLQVILLIDNGGYSMDPYVRIVQTLFRKMKTRFAHDMETYYFHNTIYEHLFSDPQRRMAVSIEKILLKDPNYKVFVIGDAAMGPYEINRTTINTYKSLKEHFKKIAWLNPDPEKYWKHTYSTQVIKELIDMYPLTPKGIEEAVIEMNKKGSTN